MVCANCYREIHAEEREKKLAERDNKKNKLEQEFHLVHNSNDKRQSKRLISEKLEIYLIKNDIENKVKKKDIAKKYGVGLTTLKRFLVKNNIIYIESKGGKLNDLKIKEFIKSFKELGTFTSVGKKYNVSDKALQKWCERNNLPWRKSELAEYVKNWDEA